MANKKVSTRLIWSKAIVSAWLCGVRIRDWLGCGKAHIGLLRMEIKHVNHKTSVHQVSKAGPMKQREVSCMNECKYMWSHQWGCIVVDQQCRESNGKAKIEGYLMSRLIIVIVSITWYIIQPLVSYAAVDHQSISQHDIICTGWTCAMIQYNSLSECSVSSWNTSHMILFQHLQLVAVLKARLDFCLIQLHLIRMPVTTWVFLWL